MRAIRIKNNYQKKSNTMSFKNYLAQFGKWILIKEQMNTTNYNNILIGYL